eukprot:CAMPEP_0172913014 /NCGR_PEP_ID=MMETSP1075-20121228/189531_1 /TAXON_ID=2916 /ORGANISM="Ceratium fusus, Strain PA161109" /LENGTH=105 /DNA_ID=CAMNT_0013771629 /DNA_START=36 /DNA_END=354 /DNA_ORIENTATION=-
MVAVSKLSELVGWHVDEDVPDAGIQQGPQITTIIIPEPYTVNVQILEPPGCYFDIEPVPLKANEKPSPTLQEPRKEGVGDGDAGAVGMGVGCSVLGLSKHDFRHK